jgi:hypothetical protein
VPTDRVPMDRVSTHPVPTVRALMRRAPTGRAAMPVAATVARSGQMGPHAARAATAPTRRVRVNLASAPIVESAAAVGAGVVAADAARAARTPATDSRQTLKRMGGVRTLPHPVSTGRVPTAARTSLRCRRPRAPASPQRLPARRPPARPPRRLQRRPRQWPPWHPKRRAPSLRRSMWCGPGRGTLPAAARTIGRRAAGRARRPALRRAVLVPRGVDGS